MSADPKPVELSEVEREALFTAGDHHPEHCDCTAFADEVGYVPGSEICEALADTYDVVARIKAAARREALLEAADRAEGAIRASDPLFFNAGVEAVVEVLRKSTLAEPERDEESGR